MADPGITEKKATRKGRPPRSPQMAFPFMARRSKGRPPRPKRISACMQCGAKIVRSPSHFSSGKKGALAGLVFCDRECQKRFFRAAIKCAWPGCADERLIEGARYKRTQHKSFLCDAHTDLLERGTGHRKFTQARLNWLNDKPIGHRHLTSVFYRWSAFVLGGEKCAGCGAVLTFGKDCNIDHKVPVSNGGKTQLSNMQPLCVPCHKVKSAREQRIIVNRRRRTGRGFHSRNFTHVEKDALIAKLRSQEMGDGFSSGLLSFGG